MHTVSLTGQPLGTGSLLGLGLASPGGCRLWRAGPTLDRDWPSVASCCPSRDARARSCLANPTSTMCLLCLSIYSTSCREGILVHSPVEQHACLLVDLDACAHTRVEAGGVR